MSGGGPRASSLDEDPPETVSTVRATLVASASAASSQTVSSALALGPVIAAGVVASTLAALSLDASSALALSPAAADADTAGVSGAAISAETSTDAVEASVAGAAMSATVAVVAMTGATVSSAGDDVGAATVSGAGALSGDEVGSDDDDTLKKRIPVCDSCFGVGVYDGPQPSVSVEVVSSVVAVDVSVAGGVAAASAAVCWCATSGIDGIAGGVPIASSYTGQFGSGFGCAGAGRVVYEFVTTGIVYEPGECAYEGARCAAETVRVGSIATAGGGACGLCVTFGTLNGGNCNTGVLSWRNALIVPVSTASVAATGTT